MKNTLASKKSPAPGDLREEYRFDYQKAKPNRFAGEMGAGTLAIVLDADVAAVFQTADSVNTMLRSVIAAPPSGSKP